tara:strand:+ start:68 stop:244 length:177 start_codon:yes stop_codon:yes gene_type:complete
MNQKRQYKTYTKAFKEEAVALVIDQGYTVPDAAESLGSEQIYFMALNNSLKRSKRVMF